MYSTRFLRASITIAAMLAGQALASDPASSPELGTEYDARYGKFGGQHQTEIQSFAVLLGYHSGPWTWKLTIPYLLVTGPGDVIPGIGRVRADNPDVAVKTVSGAGDAVALVSYGFMLDETLGGAWTAKIKLGTADETQNLGTGKNDYMIQLGFFERRGNWNVFLDAGHAVLGDMPGMPLDNAGYGRLGSEYLLPRSGRIGIVYDFRESPSDITVAQKEGSVFWAGSYGDALTFGVRLTAGLSNGSARRGAGAKISYLF